MGFLLNRKTWLTLYLLVLAGYLAAIFNSAPLPQYVLKTMLMPVLVIYFISCGYRPSSIAKWIFMALFFSWAGDVMLMFDDRYPVFFLLGLSSFLLAHLGYIIFFNRVRVEEKLKIVLWFLLPVALYYGGLMTWLAPSLGEMKIPVPVYGLVISIMLLLGMHLGFGKAVPGGRFMLCGAALFVVSDSLLAINKFYSAFAKADFFIIATYGLAQALIVHGAALWLKQANTR